jgi:hypothetical protein
MVEMMFLLQNCRLHEYISEQPNDEVVLVLKELIEWL